MSAAAAAPGPAPAPAPARTPSLVPPVTQPWARVPPSTLACFALPPTRFPPRGLFFFFGSFNHEQQHFCAPRVSFGAFLRRSANPSLTLTFKCPARAPAPAPAVFRSL